MHQLAEGKEHEKQICKKDVQKHHEGMPGSGHGRGKLRFEIKEADQVGSIVFYRHQLVAIPSPGPVHLAAKKDRKEKQDKEVIIFGNGQISVGGPEASEEKEEQAHG